VPRAPQRHRLRVAERPRRRLGTAEHGFQQVYGDEVGQARYGDVGELLRGLHDVEAAADVLAGPVQQGEPLTGAIALGDVLDRVVHADRVAVVVLQPDERHGVRRLAVRRRPNAAHVFVADHRLAGLQHPEHLRFEGLGVQTRLHIGEPASQPLLCGASAELLQGGVRPHEPQIRVHDRDAHR